MQAGMTAMIDQLRLNIAELEAETRQNQAVHNDLVKEILAEIAQRVKEVKSGAEILPFADLEAANLATEQKVKALEEKLDSAKVTIE